MSLSFWTRHHSITSRFEQVITPHGGGGLTVSFVIHAEVWFETIGIVLEAFGMQSFIFCSSLSKLFSSRQIMNITNTNPEELTFHDKHEC